MPNQMTALNNDDKLLILFYNSDVKNHKEIYAYAQSAETDTHAVDISKTKVTGTVWAEVAELLHISVTDLIDTSHSVYENRYGKGKSLNADDTIKTLQADAEMLVFPIVIKGDTAKIVKTYAEVMSFYESDTAAIKKTTIGKENKH